ncbi:hypothetical protein C8R27_1783 [Nitrosomonas ureae]|uniref:hypothetical protein n=1 Tax=Nitrosomonas ureae TaxID=44577 RepID=UPI000D75EFF0|nr:hypothetical protein [Nitrosomonas ureae]PXX05492.1 hypothetical protein C8R27_1783 [Nitrosomonas ureae]
MEKQPAVYILESGYNGTLTIGVTGHLIQRGWQHKQDLVEGFTKKYSVHFLVYYEKDSCTTSPGSAITN